MESTLKASKHHTILSFARSIKLEIFALCNVVTIKQRLDFFMRLWNTNTSNRHAMNFTEMELISAKKTIAALQMQNDEMRSQLALVMRHEEETRAYAYFDELTGLPNRRLLKDRLQQTIMLASRQRKQIAVLLIDLDGFKEVNDTMGHSAGDQLLRLVADRLAESVRSSDTVCRYGGDEFVVVLSDLHHDEAIDTVINKIRGCFIAPYAIGRQEMHVHASIGSAIYPAEGQSSQALIDCADKAMYEEKIKRKG